MKDLKEQCSEFLDKIDNLVGDVVDSDWPSENKLSTIATGCICLTAITYEYLKEYASTSVMEDFISRISWILEGRESSNVSEEVH